MLYIFAKYFVGPFLWLFLRPVVHRRAKLRVKGKAILVCNHLSLMDPILIALICPRIVHFMAKKELFKSPLASTLMRGLFAFPVDRQNADLKSLKKALQVLDEGKLFGIFPEGKRAVSESLDQLEKGAALLAVRSGAPVIPLYIHPSSYRRLRPIVMVGEAIDIRNIVASTKKSELLDVVADEIADSIDSLQAELEERFCR